MFESLAFLSDQQVRDGGRAAVAHERESTLTVLHFLIEIETRRLYLEDGYSSIFEFCTSAWHYSASSAWRRITTARCIMRFPRVLEMLQRDEVNPSTIAQVSRVLSEGNCNELLPRIVGKSQREVESIVSEYREDSAPRERARTVVVRVPLPVSADPGIFASARAGTSSLPSTDEEAIHRTLPAEQWPTVPTASPANPTHVDPVESVRPASVSGSTAPSALVLADNFVQPPCENSDYFRNGSENGLPTIGTEDNETAKMTPNGSPLSTVMAPAPPHQLACENVDYFRNGSEKRSPLAGAETNDAAPTAKTTGVVLQKRVALTLSVPVEFMAKIERLRAVTWHRLPAGASFTHVLEYALDVALAAKDPAARQGRRKQGDMNKRNPTVSADRRYIPAGVRDEVARRDAYRCTFVSRSGRRCHATAGLQVDHITPVARGGKSTIDNLRLLCAKHNRFEAERLLGGGITTMSRRPKPRER